MAHVADHLSVSALEQQYRSCTDVTAARHLQAIWLLAKGHQIAEVAATVSYTRRWVERLLARYNAEGLEALGDLRRRNGTSPSVLKPDLLDKLKHRLREPPPDGGLWTSPKVAAWMACELGLTRVADSGEGDWPFRPMVITDSGDRDRGGGVHFWQLCCGLKGAAGQGRTRWSVDCPGSPWEGPVRGAERPL